MAPVLIGLSLAAGAIFLVWLFLKHRSATVPGSGTTAGVGGLLGTLEGYIGMGNALAHNITTVGEQVANGAIGITNESVNTSARVLGGVVNAGGNILSKGSQVGAQIAKTTTSAVIGSIKAPFAAIAPVGSAVKGAAVDVAHVGEKIGSAVGTAGSAIGSAASGAYHTISGWF